MDQGLDERQYRVVAGACSQMLGHGGKSAVIQASGMSRNTVIKAERKWKAASGRPNAYEPHLSFRNCHATPTRLLPGTEGQVR